MQAYSMDLRERVAAACDEGGDTRAEVAERLGVSESWIRRLLQRRRETGSIAPRPHGGGRAPALHVEGPERLRRGGARPRAFDVEGLERLRRAVADRPDATLAELRAAAGATCGITAVHSATV